MPAEATSQNQRVRASNNGVKLSSCSRKHLRMSLSTSENLRFAWYLPFDAIVEIDPVGDQLFDGDHLYCRYAGAVGPYEKQPTVFAPHQVLSLSPAKKLFQQWKDGTKDNGPRSEAENAQPTGKKRP